MKKIINGRKYDTGTATIIGYWDNGLSYRDFYRVAKTLYQKKTGEFFLYIDGGAATEYATQCGSNEWCGGETITPLTEEEAREWAETHIDVEDFEKIFGEVEE